MAIIYSYPTATPKASDLLIGTVTYDGASGTPVDGNPTRTFNIGDIANLLGGYTLSSQAAGLNANIVLTSNLGAISAVNLLRGAGISISDNGTNGITIGNTGVLSIVGSNSTFVSSTPVLSSTGNVTISSSLSAIGTPSSSNYLRGDNRWSTPVTTITTQDSQFINLTPNSSTNGAVTITAQLSAGGSPTSSNFLRGDNVWAVPAGGGTAAAAVCTTTYYTGCVRTALLLYCNKQQPPAQQQFASLPGSSRLDAKNEKRKTKNKKTKKTGSRGPSDLINVMSMN